MKTQSWIIAHLMFSAFWQLKKVTLTLAIMAFCIIGFSQQNYWQDTEITLEIENRKDQVTVLPEIYRTLLLNQPVLKNQIWSAPMLHESEEGMIIEIPTPDRFYECFEIFETMIFNDDLSKRYSETIRTFEGRKQNDPSVVVSLSLSPIGFYALVYEHGNAWSVGPVPGLNSLKYMSYFNKDILNDPIACGVIDEVEDIKEEDLEKLLIPSSLSQYKMVYVPTGEFSVQFGVVPPGSGGTPTVANVQAAIVTSMGFANPVFKRDVGMIMQNNTPNSLIFLNPATDPYPVGVGGSSPMLPANQTTVDAAVGTANYDIGHVVAFGNFGGVAVNAVCNPAHKAKGYSSGDTPLQQITIDYFCHEVGHQYGASHTFSATTCGTAVADSQYEPGEGNSIMAYANVCNANDRIQSFSDPFFHCRSIEQMTTYIPTATCRTTPVTSGNPEDPTINCCSTISIPKNTPFVLVGAVTDATDQATLVSDWEQYDLAPATTSGPPSPMQTVGPNFRLRPASSIGNKRIFPATAPQGDNDEDWERLSTVPRTFNFRLVARDGNSNWGRTAKCNTVVTVTNEGPFAITAPNGTETVASGTTPNLNVTWGGVSSATCGTVDIFLSIDGGNTYPYTLATNTANDGNEMVNINTPATGQAKVLVQCHTTDGTYLSSCTFFDASNANFNITSNCMAKASNLCPTNAMTFNQGDAGLNLSLSNHFGAVAANHTFNITATSPTGPLANATTSGGTTCQTPFGTEKYEMFDFVPSTSGSYTFTKSSSNAVFSIFTAAGYNPAMPCSGTFLKSNSTGTIQVLPFATVNLTACTKYKLVVWSINGAIISNTITFAGPGTIYESGAAPSSDYAYTYVAVNTANNQIDAHSSTSNFTSLAAGTYCVYGVSYKSAGSTPPAIVNPQTWVDGNMTVAQVLAGGACAVFSGNCKPLTINSTNPCNITAISVANISACTNGGNDTNPANDTYTANVTVIFANPPVSGNLVLSGDGSATVAIGSLGSTTSHTFMGVSMPADGGAISLTATFSGASPACTFSNATAGTAPAACSTLPCNISAIAVANISACTNGGNDNNPANDTYTANVTVTFVNPPASGNLVLSGDGAATVAVGSLGSTTSHTFMGVSMPADGGAISLTATFSGASPACTFSNATAGTAPAACSNICDVMITSVTPTHQTCPNTNTGTITIVATGTGTLEYSIGGAFQTGNSFANQAPGTYTVTVRIQGSNPVCSTPQMTTINAATPMMLATTPTNIICNGASTGAIALTVTGGASPYTFAWTTIGGSGQNATAEDQTGLTAGAYTVVVTDANSCIATTMVTLTQPSAIVPSCSLTSNVICNGGSNGVATVSATGGTSPYSFNWGTANPNALSAGTYTPTVTDANNCTATCMVTITEPTPLVPSCSITSNATCNGGSNGVATVSATGGTSPYSFNWGTANSNALAAGTYTPTVTDANNCTATCMVTITEPTAITSTVMITNVNCNGGSNGAINSTIAGGTSPYTYSWSNGAGTEDISGLNAGAYTLTVTDANACSISFGPHTVTEPVLLEVSCNVIMNASCAGQLDGAAGSVVTGGTPPYFYSWSNGFASQNIQNLLSGTYSVTVTDFNSCTTTCSVNVSEPGELTAMCNVQNNVTCFGFNDGLGLVTATMGTPPYSYLWSDGQTTSSASDLAPGNHNVTVTDGNGCMATCGFTITEPSQLEIVCAANNDVSCFGAADGSASVGAIGGTPPYSYNWSNGQSNSTAFGLSGGTFTVDVVDANGCVETCAVTIYEPTLLLASCSVISNVTCYNGKDGQANLNVSGGTSPYDIDWGDVNPNALYDGTYTVTVTDANDCVETCSVTITQPANLNIFCGQTTPINCEGETGSAGYIVQGGVAPYDVDWNGENPNALPVGTYYVYVTDAVGCTAFCDVQIEANYSIEFGVIVEDADCTSGTNGSATLSNLNGGIAPYIYEWSNGNTTDALTDIPAGKYSITITDANGCSSIDHIVVEDLGALEVSIINNTADCYTGNNDICLFAEISNGLAPYTYEWSNGSTNSGICNQSAGMYTVIVIDANGCQGTAFSLMVAGGFDCSVDETSGISSYGICDGELTAHADGAAPFTYEWSNGSNAPNIDGLCVGEYCVTITDANGCECISCYFITEPGNPGCFEVGGAVWYDDNQDGMQSQGEGGVYNAIAQLFSAGSDGVFGTNDDILEDIVLTNVWGYYVFECVDPDGIYVIDILSMQNGYQFTSSNVGSDDEMDSDVNSLGRTQPFSITNNNYSFSAGIYPGCDDITNAGQIGYSHTICTGATANTLNEISPATGGNGDLEYLWLSATLSNLNLSDWAEIPNSNSSSYSPGALYETTFFLRCVRRAGCNSFVAESNVVGVAVTSSGLPGCGSSLVAPDGENELERSEVWNEDGEGTIYNAYPNPFTESFVLQSSKVMSSEQVEIQVYSMDGSLVQKQNWKEDQGQINLDLSKESSGIYMIRIMNSDTGESQTIKVQKI